MCLTVYVSPSFIWRSDVTFLAYMISIIIITIQVLCWFKLFFSIGASEQILTSMGLFWFIFPEVLSHYVEIKIITINCVTTSFGPKNPFLTIVNTFPYWYPFLNFNQIHFSVYKKSMVIEELCMKICSFQWSHLKCCQFLTFKKQFMYNFKFVHYNTPPWMLHLR